MQFAAQWKVCTANEAQGERESEVEFGAISTASTVDQRLLYSTLLFEV